MWIKRWVWGIVLLFGMYSLIPADDMEYPATSPSALAVYSAGFALMGISSLLQKQLTFSEQYNAITEYREYTQSTTGGNYDDSSTDANRIALMTLGQWTGGAAFTGSLLLFPAEEVTMSGFGRVVSLAGVGIMAAGSILDSMAVNHFIMADGYYMQYEEASSGTDELYQNFEYHMSTYSLLNLLGIILRGSGGLVHTLGFVMPGKKRPVAESSLQKGLLLGALAGVTAGVFTKYAAQLQGLQLNDLQAAYENSTDNLDTVYTQYKNKHTAYVALNITTWGLWAAGTGALTAALIINPQRTRADAAASSSGEAAADDLTEMSGSGNKNFTISGITASPGDNGSVTLGVTLSK